MLSRDDIVKQGWCVGIVCRYGGRCGEAGMLHKRTLAGREKHLRSEYPDTLRSLKNLTIVYQCQGRYQEAKTLYRRTLACDATLLGSEHPQTLRTIDNLTNIGGEI
jgi:hypothetical protein